MRQKMSDFGSVFSISTKFGNEIDYAINESEMPSFDQQHDSHANDWLGYRCHEKDGIVTERSWSIGLLLSDMQQPVNSMTRARRDGDTGKFLRFAIVRRQIDNRLPSSLV